MFFVTNGKCRIGSKPPDAYEMKAIIEHLPALAAKDLVACEIVRGRNYGFPPRDEKWLPDLQSEPPVVAFGPQHQSTCGLVFNEPKKGQGLFGPKWWEGNALVAGESRGKIWRVQLATDYWERKKVREDKFGVWNL